jgi:hypothetical protein
MERSFIENASRWDDDTPDVRAKPEDMADF